MNLKKRTVSATDLISVDRLEELAGVSRSRGRLTIGARLTADELEQKLRGIMTEIHSKCVHHGYQEGYTNYVKGANIAGFIKVADAMLAYGVM